VHAAADSAVRRHSHSGCCRSRHDPKKEGVEVQLSADGAGAGLHAPVMGR